MDQQYDYAPEPYLDYDSYHDTTGPYDVECTEGNNSYTEGFGNENDLSHNAYRNGGTEVQQGPYEHEGLNIVDAQHIDAMKLCKTFLCNSCGERFPSNNKLHQHVRERACYQSINYSYAGSTVLSDYKLVESSAKPPSGTGNDFRRFHYVTSMGAVRLDTTPILICIDTGCTMTLADKAFILAQLLEVVVKRMVEPIIVRGINGYHESSEFMTIPFFLKGTL